MGNIGSRQVRFEVLPSAPASAPADRPAEHVPEAIRRDPTPTRASTEDVGHPARAEPARS